MRQPVASSASSALLPVVAVVVRAVIRAFIHALLRAPGAPGAATLTCASPPSFPPRPHLDPTSTAEAIPARRAVHAARCGKPRWLCPRVAGENRSRGPPAAASRRASGELLAVQARAQPGDPAEVAAERLLGAEAGALRDL